MQIIHRHLNNLLNSKELEEFKASMPAVLVSLHLIRIQ